MINNNNLKGRIPLRLTRLDPSVFRLFRYNVNTDLCEPPNKEFHDWVARIRSNGGEVTGTGVPCAGDG